MKILSNNRAKMDARSLHVESSDSEDTQLLQKSLQDPSDTTALCEIVFKLQPEIRDDELKAACKNNGNTVVSHDEEELEYERDSSKWPIKAVELMIQHRLRLDPAFNSPRYAKNKLWDGISEYLKDSNFHFEGKECHLKFRNMLATYKKNVERVNTYGEECLKWKWFNMFHSILKFKPVVEQEKSLDRCTRDRPRREIRPTMKRPPSETPEIPEIECRKWNRNSIKMLLDLRLQTIDFFNDPRSHKVKYWRKIAKLLCENGYDVTDRDCIIKWHNLVNTYRSNLRKAPTDYVRWEWFELMHEIHKQPTAKNEHKSKNPTEIKEDQQDIVVSLSSDDSLPDNGSLQSTYAINMNDKDSFDDPWNDDLNLKNRPLKKSKKHQKAYWREKLKLQKSAERRRRREWTERKQLEMQKINLKKQKLKVYHRLTNTLEKFASSSRLRDFLSTD